MKKMLHVTPWDMAGARTNVTCYVQLFDRVKMLHVVSWDMAGVRTNAQQWQWRWVQKKHLFQAIGRQLHVQKPVDENAPRKKLHEQSMHASKRSGPKPRI